MALLSTPGTRGSIGVQQGRSSCAPGEVAGEPTLLEPVYSHNWEGLGATARVGTIPVPSSQPFPCPWCPQSPQAAQQVPGAGLCQCLLGVKWGEAAPREPPSCRAGARVSPRRPPQPPVQWLVLLMESPGCSA